MSEKILVVDDNPTNRQILKVILTNAAYNVITLKSGQEILEQIDDIQPDILLLDIMMPDIDGFEVCTQLKSREQWVDLPILFISALDDYENRVKGLQIGAVDYIPKPFNKDELLARVNTHLSIRSLNRQLQVKIEENESLVRAMSHDLSNLLQVNLGTLDLLLMLPHTNDKVTKYLHVMEDMSLKMKELISNIRNIIAVESGKRQVSLEAVQIKPVIENAIRIFQDKMDRKKIRLVTDPDPVPDECSVLVEPVSFANSVINNIISNAIKFSYPDSEILVELKRDENTTSITFRDTGVGIQKSRLSAIFSPNQSTSTSGTAGEKGTGFGMPLVHKFVDKYGGRIFIESRHIDEFPQDHGTGITIVLKNP